jgi:Zn-dependent protease with chaperone function
MTGATAPPIIVKRWPTERPLFVLNAIAATAIWLALVSSRSTLMFFGFIFALLFLVHLAAIAQIRGSAVRVGPDQFPELHARVEQLAWQMGLKYMPAVYIAQQDGALNAFATRLMRSHMVVLLADLLEACGEDRAARDMILGHELGHIRAGHLRWHWFLLPTALIPFLGAALSRAREYTCDRYGRAAAGDDDGALLGLTILAAGPKYGRLVNRAAYVRQRSTLRGATMFLGEWLGSHPPLTKRIVALVPHLVPDAEPVLPGRLAWVRPVIAGILVVLVGTGVLSTWGPRAYQVEEPGHVPPPTPIAEKQVARDFERLREVIDAEVRSGRLLPWDVWDLYNQWENRHPGVDAPTDPFSGYWYDYQQQGGTYRLLSMGPDGQPRTSDDIVFDSRVAKD